MITYAMDRADVSVAHVKTDRALGILLGMLFIVVYMQGFAGRMGIPRVLVKLSLEFPVMLIFLHLINRGARPLAPGLVFVILYTMWAVLSAVHNDDTFLKAFLYCRYVIYAYIVFAAVWSTPMERTTVRRVNGLIAILFVVQILASTHEAFILGERLEAHVGTLYSEGGELGTEFPLMAMALTMPFYFYWRRTPLLLVLAWAFFVIGYASSKRAIYFFGPSLYFLILVWYVVKEQTSGALKGAAVAASVFLVAIPLLLFGVSHSGGIGHTGPARPHEQVAHAVNYALEYASREHSPGQSAGRVATSRRVISSLWKGDNGTRLFGWGPSVAMGHGGRCDELMIEYGITGWTRDVISAGVPAMLLYVLFHIYLFGKLWQGINPTWNSYWYALGFGVQITFVVVMMCYFTYSSVFLTGGGQLSYVYFYLLALLASPQHRHIVTDWAPTTCDDFTPTCECYLEPDTQTPQRGFLV